MTLASIIRDRLGVARVLSFYAIVLILLPSRYTIGGLALTGPMLVGLVLGALWAAGFATGRPTALLRPGVGRALVVFSAATVLAYTVTMVRPNLVTAASAADRRMAGTICALGAAVLALDALRSSAAIERVLRALVTAGGVMAAIGIVQYAFGWELAQQLRVPGFGSGQAGFIFSRGGQTRVAGTMRHPIEFGILCAALLPLALHVSTHAARTTHRRLAALAVGLLALALPMGLSRASVLAVCAALVTLLVLLPSERRNRLVEMMLVAGLVFVAFVPNLAFTMRDLFTTDLAEGSNTARAQSAQFALDRFHEDPLFGQGLGSLGNVIVDNQYLLTLAEGGIAGIGAMVILWLGVVRSARDARRVGDRNARDLGAAFVASTVALAVGSFGFATLGQGTTLGVALLIVGLAGAHQRVTLADAELRPSESARGGTDHRSADLVGARSAT